MNSFFAAVEAWPVSQEISMNPWLFPAVEVIHVMALAIVIGSIFLVDARLLNFRDRDRPVSAITAEVLPLTWAAFVVALGSGLLMFISSATRYWDNDFFRIKMLLLLLAGANMLVFHLFTGRALTAAGIAAPPPLGARAAGGLSMTFWVGIVVCGRWIGFT